MPFFLLFFRGACSLYPYEKTENKGKGSWHYSTGSNSRCLCLFYKEPLCLRFQMFAVCSLLLATCSLFSKDIILSVRAINIFCISFHGSLAEISGSGVDFLCLDPRHLLVTIFHASKDTSLGMTIELPLILTMLTSNNHTSHSIG